MYGIGSVIILQALLATGSSSYQRAYDQAAVAGKPLLVLVASEKNSACLAMSDRTLPALRQSGQLKDVVFTQVDSDASPKLTEQLARGEELPQLVLYTPVGKQWRRTHLAGARSAQEVREFLDQQIARGKEVARERQQGQSGAARRVTYTIPMYSSGGG